MLCESCRKRDATIHITQIVDGRMTKGDLCDQCGNEKLVETRAETIVQLMGIFESGPLKEKLDNIVAHDPRFRTEAYAFVLEAVGLSSVIGSPMGHLTQRHIPGKELLEVLRVMAQLRLRSRAKSTLNSWGLHSCEDFGEVLFNLASAGLVGKRDEDRREDFQGGYSFEEAFPEN